MPRTRRAVRTACAAGGADRACMSCATRGCARRIPGCAREAVRQAPPVSRRVGVLDLAAPADGEHVPGRGAAAAARAGSRSTRTARGSGRRPGPRRRGVRAARGARRCSLRSRRAGEGGRAQGAFDFSFEEIAGAEGMPVGTAKCYAHRGRNGLRERLVRMKLPLGQGCDRGDHAAPRSVSPARRGDRARAERARGRAQAR